MGNMYYHFDNYPKHYKSNPERDGYFVYDYEVDLMFFVEATTPKKAAEVYLGTSVTKLNKSSQDSADCYVAIYPDDEPIGYYRATYSRPNPMDEIATLSNEELLEKYTNALFGHGGVAYLRSDELKAALYKEIMSRMGN